MNGSNREPQWILHGLLDPRRQLGCPETPVTHNQRCETSKKSEDLIYTAAVV
jgi:hypothetical protein